jgi:hypothetical protein
VLWAINDKYPNGALFTVPASVYTNPHYALVVGSDAASIPVSLLTNGATVANIPYQTTGLGGMCYLVNLPGLSESAIGEVTPPQMTARQLVIAIQSMLKWTTPAVPGTKDMEVSVALGQIAGGVTAAEQTSNQNLIVYVNPDPNNPSDPDGGIYSIPPDVYTTTALDAGDAGGATSLLMFGTVVANMPADKTPPGGYLINLPALTPPAVQFDKRPKFTASQVLVAVKAMLEHTEAMAANMTDAGLLESVQGVVTKYA